MSASGNGDSGSSSLILGAGYIGAMLAECLLEQDDDVVLADNWYATDRQQLAELESEGARVETADIRDRARLDELMADRPGRVFLLAAQASRPISERDPDYTEETNVIGARRVAEAVAAAAVPALVYASSLNVYGPSLSGSIGVDHPLGRQRDLAHLSKIYAEQSLSIHAERSGFDLAILRLGIVYGPSPAEHDSPESQTVVDKFRRLADKGEPLPLDDGGKTTIGVAHVEDVARVLCASPGSPGVTVANVAAECVTVADVAALARGEQPAGSPACSFETPFDYRYRLADYMANARA
jgi:nucleoside-diphosphate-sugar epimerase